METRQGIHSEHAKTLDTKALRKEFIQENIFTKDELTMTYSHIDRIVFGGVMPVSKKIDLSADLGKAFGVDFFLQRREIGLINIGSAGKITVDGTTYNLKNQDALYIGMGAKVVSFESDDSKKPAKFYYNSAPAHCNYPTKLVTLADSAKAHLGDVASSNKRTINKYFVPDVLPTCQLVMGMTMLEDNSLWNTMPCHTHERRMEVYLYFDMDEDTNVFHYMGEPDETRHLVMRNEQAVISPSWSIHSGVGTKSYTFIWGMVGENQTFDDMDHIAMKDIY